MNLAAEDITRLNVKLTRKYNAPAHKIFNAWTEPKILTQWFGPKGVITLNAKVNLEIGGEYHFTMQEPNGNVIDIGGKYREIIPNKKLVFTWVLDGQSCSAGQGQYAETLVTINFEESGTSTQLTLTHDFLPNDKSKEEHTVGWAGSLDCLEEIMD